MRHRTLPLLCSFLAGCSPGDTRANEDPGTPPEIPVAPSPASREEGPIVVFLGTSLTAGLGLSRVEETYVSRLDALADSVGTPIRAVNAGVSGDTSAGGVARLDWVLREPLDILVIELGANDGLRGQDPAALRSNLVSIAERTRARYPDAGVVIAGMEAPPNLGPDYTADFREAFPDAARATGSALVPFLLDGVAGVPELNQDDGIHPTPAGHERMARTVWPVLRPLVAEWYAARGSERAAS